MTDCKFIFVSNSGSRFETFCETHGVRVDTVPPTVSRCLGGRIDDLETKINTLLERKQ